MNIKNKSKGFTLIELLVVIGIIAILVAIIISNVNSAKNKTKDALIKETMGTPLTKLSIEYYVNGQTKSYAAFCEDDATEEFLSKINSPEDPECKDNSKEWGVCAQLYSDNTKAWCADNTGLKKVIEWSACDGGLRECD